METWHVTELDIEAHHPQVLRSDAETRAIGIQLPAGEQMQSHQVHERTLHDRRRRRGRDLPGRVVR